MKLRTLTLLVAFFAVVATASAKTHAYFPVSGTCRPQYVRKTIRVAERRHGRMVRRRRVECVAKPTTATDTATNVANTPSVTAAPTIAYSSSVDPSITQSSTNPLDVTISYSASATSTENGIVTNLATTDDLPVGVLNLFSTDGGAGSDLICSMNVGNSTSGGTCNVTYPQTGSFFLTVQYITSAASSVTSTEAIDVEPLPSTATATVGSAVPFSFTQWDTSQWPAVDLGTFSGYNILVNDASSDPNSPGVTATLTDTTTGATFPLGTYPVGSPIQVSVFTSDISGTNNEQQIPAGDVDVQGSYIAATDVLTVSVVSEADYADGFEPSGPSNTVQVWPVS